MPSCYAVRCGKAGAIDGCSRASGRVLIYGGWNAGDVVTSPDLDGIELVDDPSVNAEGYKSVPSVRDWDWSTSPSCRTTARISPRPKSSNGWRRFGRSDTCRSGPCAMAR